jgi:hypothetical protein
VPVLCTDAEVRHASPRARLAGQTLDFAEALGG